MRLKVNIVDTFTNKNFKGNSAAVMILDSWLDDSIMQDIAIENNLSETAFLVKDKKEIYHIRWFSPLSEIDFCGHATLASSHVLFKEDTKLHTIKFYAQAVGDFDVEKKDDGFIQMNFPNREPKQLNEIPNELLNGLSIKPKKVLKNEQAYFAIFDNQDDVMSLTYEKKNLVKLAPLDVVVTAPSSVDEFDFASRYFWPANGGKEDPVTGSIHAGLAPYWAKELGKNSLIALQASKREGKLLCEVKENRVLISGQAVSYLEGFIEI